MHIKSFSMPFTISICLFALEFAGAASGQATLEARRPGSGYSNSESVFFREHSVKVEIQDSAAVTSIEQVFANRTNAELEGLYTFQIPLEATIDRFSMFMAGKEILGEVIESEKAKQIYESLQGSG